MRPISYFYGIDDEDEEYKNKSNIEKAHEWLKRNKRKSKKFFEVLQDPKKNIYFESGEVIVEHKSKNEIRQKIL